MTSSAAFASVQNAFDDDDEWDCPLCMEEMDVADRNFHPCLCGYQICRFCWHKINQDMNKLCPACRREYTEEEAVTIAACASPLASAVSAAASFAAGSSGSSSPCASPLVPFESAPSSTSASPLSATLRPISLAAAKRTAIKGAVAPPHSEKAASPSAKEAKDRETLIAARKHLANLRVIQKNLVYVIGISPKIAHEDVLAKPEYFAQYGHIVKIVVNKRNYIGVNSGHLPSASVYITYARREDAARAIQLIDGTVHDGRTLRASYGTTKYCTFFLRGISCQNGGCMYLHEAGEEADSFTKEQMAEGFHLDRFVPKHAGSAEAAATPAFAVQTAAISPSSFSEEAIGAISSGCVTPQPPQHIRACLKLPTLADVFGDHDSRRTSVDVVAGVRLASFASFFSFNPFADVVAADKKMAQAAVVAAGKYAPYALLPHLTTDACRSEVGLLGEWQRTIVHEASDSVRDQAALSVKAPKGTDLLSKTLVKSVADFFSGPATEERLKQRSSACKQPEAVKKTPPKAAVSPKVTVDAWVRLLCATVECEVATPGKVAASNGASHSLSRKPAALSEGAAFATLVGSMPTALFSDVSAAVDTKTDARLPLDRRFVQALELTHAAAREACSCFSPASVVAS